VQKTGNPCFCFSATQPFRDSAIKTNQKTDAKIQRHGPEDTEAHRLATSLTQALFKIKMPLAKTLPSAGQPSVPSVFSMFSVLNKNKHKNCQLITQIAQTFYE
jgi:hypothetical protein